MKSWTTMYMEWLNGKVHFDEPALEGHVAGLRARGGARGGTDCATRESHCGSHRKIGAGIGCRDRRPTGVARHRDADVCEHHRRARDPVALHHSTAADGIQQPGTE